MRRFFLIFLVLCILALLFGMYIGSRTPIESHVKIEVPEYKSGLTQDYIRNGSACIAYRVHTAIPLAELSDDQLLAVFDDLTNDDNYFLHTIWFYDDESLIYEGGGYDVCIEETSKQATEIDRRTEN